MALTAQLRLMAWLAVCVAAEWKRCQSALDAMASCNVEHSLSKAIASFSHAIASRTRLSTVIVLRLLIPPTLRLFLARGPALS